MKDDLITAERRAIQYWHIDGTMELSFGGICLLLGLYFFAQSTLPKESLLYRILDIGFLLILLLGGLLTNALVKLIKERITYPRTGFVAYRRKYGLSRWVRIAISAGLSMLMAVLVVLLITNPRFGMTWMPAVSGILLGIVWLIIAYRTALVRFYLQAVIIVLAGVGLSLAGVGNFMGMAIFYGLMSLALLVSGGVTLWIYLRQTQHIEEIQEEGRGGYE